MAERTSLTGVSISEGYPQLIHVSSTDGLTAVSTQLYDANGTALPAWASTTEMRFGDASDYTEIQNDGDVSFVGGGGLSFSEIHFFNNSTITTLNSAAKVQVTVFDTDGESNNGSVPDHTNDHITVTVAGRYLAMVSITVKNNAAQAHAISIGLWKNNGNAQFQNVHAHHNLTGGSTDIASIGISGIIDLAINDTIELWGDTGDAADRSVTFEDGTFTLIQIGGT